MRNGAAGRLTAEWKTAFAGGGEFSARLTVQGERDHQQKEEWDEADFAAAGAPRRTQRARRRNDQTDLPHRTARQVVSPLPQRNRTENET